MKQYFIALQDEQTKISELGMCFSEAKAALEATKSICLRLAQSPVWALPLEELLDCCAEEAHQRLYEISWKIADTPAKSAADLQQKAKVLEEWCEPREDDLPTALMRSLCADLHSASFDRSDD